VTVISSGSDILLFDKPDEDVLLIDVAIPLNNSLQLEYTQKMNRLVELAENQKLYED
jgi:hypothetical protein